MGSPPPPTDDRNIDHRTSLDWVDLLIVLLLGYAVALVYPALGLRMTGSRVGYTLVPLFLGALLARRRVWPSRRPAVKKALTLTGVVATLLMVGGALVAAFGGVILVRNLSDEQASEADALGESALDPELQAEIAAHEAEAHARSLRASAWLGLGGISAVVFGGLLDGRRARRTDEDEGRPSDDEERT